MVAGLLALRFEPARLAPLLPPLTALTSVAERFKATFFDEAADFSFVFERAFSAAFLGAGLAALLTEVEVLLMGDVAPLALPAFFFMTYVLACLRGDLEDDLAGVILAGAFLTGALALLTVGLDAIVFDTATLTVFEAALAGETLVLARVTVGLRVGEADL